MAPDSTSPSGSLLLSLPPELLHQVFSELPLGDVHATRKTCVLLGTIGLDYLCDEIALIYHPDSFKALTQIANYPRYSKRVRALFYIIDRCKLASFDEWDADRRDPKPAPWAADAPSREGDNPPLEWSDAELLELEIREENEYLEGRLARIAAVPLITRRLGYIAYSELCQAQMKILKKSTTSPA